MICKAPVLSNNPIKFYDIHMSHIVIHTAVIYMYIEWVLGSVVIQYDRFNTVGSIR